MTDSTFPPAEPHGLIEQIFDGIFVVSGSVALPFPFTTRCSRNMTIVRDGESLTLVSSMRLDEAGLAALDKLGKVEHVIRIAAFHGKDDRFYKDRYGAKVWAVRGSAYETGFKVGTPAEKGYFQPDVWMDERTTLPIRDAKLQTVPGIAAEGVVLLAREKGILLTGDALQNWECADEHFNFLGRTMMKLMGFIKPCNIGPGWLRGAKPDLAELRKLRDLEFEHVLPVHGTPVKWDARRKFAPAFDRLS